MKNSSLKICEYVPSLEKDVIFSWDRNHMVTASFENIDEILGEMYLPNNSYTEFMMLIDEACNNSQHPLLNGVTLEESFET